ncbi:Aste57867_3952 [Aphanomyces stellatus]|uniref:Aste57867_3952 protein n=1 Tax=Aphanomyces stellatus TaxID=120398 RepID=A0A485KG99_9STRA|nr:hypothetical protein As57867_003941 [Aphanomyces stellatus]VFT81089.1 Aste57867_3952 [Aphanomyces stellatus]
MGGSIVGSISYISLSQVHMAYDFWWTSFNATGTHAYIARLIDTLLKQNPQSGAIELHDAAYWDQPDYSRNATQALVAPNEASLVQHEEMATSLPSVVLGLRSMDACLMPWIAAQYC